MLNDLSLRPNQRKSFRSRVFFIFGLFLCLLIFLLVKIAYIQLIEQDKYKESAERQAKRITLVRAKRGEIYDQSGKVIVDNRPIYSLYITPAYFPKDNSKEGMLRKGLLNYLSKKLKIPIDKLSKKITIENPLKQNKYTPILIKRDLDRMVYSELKENETYLQGVEIDVVSTRRYLLKEKLAHTIGYTGIIDSKTWKKFKNNYDNPNKNPYKYKDTIIGKKGLEKYQDIILRGKDGLATRLIDSRGRPIPNTTKIVKKPQPGKDIYLTIDISLQEVVKNAMNNQRGAVIVSKPATGEILALVSNPSFDSNIFTNRQSNKIRMIAKDSSKPLFNRITQAYYPPSSLFKVVVAIAALEEKISPNKTFTCIGGIEARDRFFKCHNIHGTINMIEAIELSCNAYFYQLGALVGWETIYKYAKQFVLGEGYNGEAGRSVKGNLPNARWKKKYFKEIWYPGDTYNHSIGQGYILLPPIQIHNIISTIANDGVLYKPYLIKKIVDPNKIIDLNSVKKIINLVKNKVVNPETIIKRLDLNKYIDPLTIKKVIDLVVIKKMNDPAAIKKKVDLEAQIITKKTVLKKRFISKKTLKLIKVALRRVVKNGTARYSRFSNKLIAGKTGTAQNTRGAPHALFSCYAPYDSKSPKDRIAVTVLVENMEGGGGFIAAPIATAIIKYYLDGGTPLSESQKEMGLTDRFIIDQTDDHLLIDVFKELDRVNNEEKIQAETEDILQKIKMKQDEMATKASQKPILIVQQIQSEHRKMNRIVLVDKAIKQRIENPKKPVKQKKLRQNISVKKVAKLSRSGLEKIKLEKLRLIQSENKLKEKKARLKIKRIKKEQIKRDRKRLRRQRERQKRLRKEQERLKLARLKHQQEIKRMIRLKKRKNRKRFFERTEKGTTETEENRRVRKMIEEEEKRLKKQLEKELE